MVGTERDGEGSGDCEQGGLLQDSVMVIGFELFAVVRSSELSLILNTLFSRHGLRNNKEPIFANLILN